MSPNCLWTMRPSTRMARPGPSHQSGESDGAFMDEVRGVRGIATVAAEFGIVAITGS